MKVLISGGAGFIGSTIASAASTPADPGDPGQPGHRAARVHRGPHLLPGRHRDGALIDRIFAEHPDIEAVVHCAALIVVPDSVADPVGYYRANVAKSLDFVAHLLRNGCRRMIFSSSASIYAPGADLSVDEDSPLDPQSPYARTKAVCEAMFADIAAAEPVRVLSLRYFNPIGADPQMRTGLQLARPTHALGQMIMAHAGRRAVPSSPAPTTRPGTAPASATTSTCGTWPAAHVAALTGSTTLIPGPGGLRGHQPGHRHGHHRPRAAVGVQQRVDRRLAAVEAAPPARRRRRRLRPQRAGRAAAGLAGPLLDRRGHRALAAVGAAPRPGPGRPARLARGGLDLTCASTRKLRSYAPVTRPARGPPAADPAPRPARGPRAGPGPGGRAGRRRRAAGAAGGLWAAPRRALTAGLVLTITFIASEALAVVTVMPLVARDLGGLDLYGWVFSAFMLGSVVGIVVAGREADRRGPGGPYVAGLALFAAGLLVAGLAPAMPVLVAGRALQGLGAGAVPAVAYVSIGRSLPERAAAQDDGRALHRLGGAGRGRAGRQRRRGPPVRLALGLPRPGAGRRRHRVAGHPRPVPAGTAAAGAAGPRAASAVEHRIADGSAPRPAPGCSSPG